jgi:hypothetical protein
MLTAWRAATFRYSERELRLFVEFQQQLERIMRDQLTRMCGELSGRLLPATSQVCAHNHRYACITTGNLQLLQQMGTETRQ